MRRSRLQSQSTTNWRFDRVGHVDCDNHTILSQNQQMDDLKEIKRNATITTAITKYNELTIRSSWSCGMQQSHNFIAKSTNGRFEGDQTQCDNHDCNQKVQWTDDSIELVMWNATITQFYRKINKWAIWSSRSSADLYFSTQCWIKGQGTQNPPGKILSSTWCWTVWWKSFLDNAKVKFRSSLQFKQGIPHWRSGNHS
jgi:hypothetical protein